MVPLPMASQGTHMEIYEPRDPVKTSQILPTSPQREKSKESWLVLKKGGGLQVWKEGKIGGWYVCCTHMVCMSRQWRMCLVYM